MLGLDMPSRWLLLIVPDCQVSTKELFSHPELTTTSPRCRIEALETPSGLSMRPAEFSNAFEPLVRKLYTPVAQAMDWLEQYAPTHLSGTGCCIFAPFETEQMARATAEKLPENMRGIVVKTLNHSPLYSQL
jgi:4-diphosphocytidyl-2-C-methyl-D-erythritol kinase